MDIPRLRTPEGVAALAAAGGLLELEPLRALEVLRAAYDARLAGDALTQARLRTRGREKFGVDADRMLFTSDGLEQATRAEVAAHRAARLAGRPLVLDLCCGVGGDLRELTRVADEVVGIDREPSTALCAAHNAPRAPVVVGDVTTLRLPARAAVIVDPGRRSGGRRTFDPSAYSPPLPWVLDLLRRHDGVAKVAPGVPHGAVPGEVEAEWVSWRGELKEAALWSASLVTARRRATVLPGGATLVGTGVAAPVGALGDWLHEPDPAVIRAGLVAEAAVATGARLVDPTIAFLTTDGPVSSPFVRSWQVLEALPFSVKRLRAALRSRGVGSVTVKKRGTAVGPEQLRRDLRLTGDGPAAVVVLTRIAGEHWALICAERA